MQEPSSSSINHAIKNMDLAFKSFFRGGGYPNFKKKVGPQSFGIPNPPKSPVNFSDGTISIPKIPDIKTVFSRKFDGEIRSMTLSRTASGKYFASILVMTPEIEPVPPTPRNAIGVDLGLTDFGALSTGEKIANPRFLRENIARLKVLQRRASKKKKGSKNSKKALRRVAILNERITNRRNDFLHKVSTNLIRDNQTDTICVEDLAVRNMIQNRSLSQAISDVSWSEFVRQLEYKGRWYGKNVIKIDRFYASSKTCSTCGHKVDKLPLSTREWTCAGCGAIHDRDINAAINIRNSGLDRPGATAERPAIKGRNEAVISLKN
jgi:putative transposase